MRLGLITYGLDRPLTGIGRYTVELARALIQHIPDIELTLLTAGEPRALWAGAPLPYRRAHLPGCRLLPALLTLGQMLIPHIARRRHLDIVHDPTGVTPFGLGTGPAQSLVTVHDVFSWVFPGTNTHLDQWIYRYWLPHRLRRIGHVLTDSATSKADIARYLNVLSPNITVVALAPSALFKPAALPIMESVRARYALPERYILFVGGRDKRRNLARLLAAHEQLDPNLTPPLVIVGARRPTGDTPANSPNNHRVVYLGHVPDTDLPALYSGAVAFIFPSLYEGFGLPPLEAMACGAPVLCSNAASLPEVVADAAITFDPYNVDAMATVMRQVLADADVRETLRQRGLARATQFTWERTARETWAVYQRVLEATA